MSLEAELELAVCIARDKQVAYSESKHLLVLPACSAELSPETYKGKWKEGNMTGREKRILDHDNFSQP